MRGNSGAEPPVPPEIQQVPGQQRRIGPQGARGGLERPAVGNGHGGIANRIKKPADGGVIQPEPLGDVGEVH